MLKLEKTPREGGLTLRLRERDRFFHPLLLKALMIASLMHLGCFILFHIAPFAMVSSFTFPPVAVEPLQPIQSVLVSTEPHSQEVDSLFPPLNLLPSLDWLSLPQETLLNPTVAYDIQALKHLENSEWPLWVEPLPLLLDEPIITLTVSGNLGQLQLIAEDPLLQERRPLTQSPSSYTFVTYQVQVHEQTGEIFWYERTRSSGEEVIDLQTERILPHLHFMTDGSFDTVTGHLHFSVLK